MNGKPQRRIVFPFKKAIYEKGLKPGGNLSILCQHEKFSHTFGKTKTEHCEKVDKVWWVFPWEYSGSFWKLTPALQTLNFWHNLCINRAATRISMLFSTDLLCSTLLRADNYPITFLILFCVTTNMSFYVWKQRRIIFSLGNTLDTFC